MLHLITAFLAAVRVFFRNRVDTSLEVLALRQQVAVLKRKSQDSYWRNTVRSRTTGLAAAKAKAANAVWNPTSS